MEPVFNKTFFKFLFGFIFIVVFGLFGAALFSRYFDVGTGMFANPIEAR
jgi:hypothetical protein